MTLIELLDGFVKSSGGDLTLACVNFVKAWRTEKLYRQLNAQLCVADKTKSLLISGTGEVLEVEGEFTFFFVKLKLIPFRWSNGDWIRWIVCIIWGKSFI